MMRVALVVMLLSACGSSASPGGPTAPGGSCTSSNTVTCMGSCQVCLLPRLDGGIDFEHGSCARLCDNPGGKCADGKTCMVLKDVPVAGMTDYNDSGECDPMKTAVCL